MKLTELLREQHRALLEVFARIECTEDPNERRRLLDELVDALQAHGELETRVLYPAIRSRAAGGELDGLVLEAIEAHHVIDLVLEEAPELDPESESFAAKTSVLRKLVERHIDEEEALLFEAAPQVDVGARADGADRP
jgi:hemerythrin-like domain-containing protein